MTARGWEDRDEKHENDPPSAAPPGREPGQTVLLWWLGLALLLVWGFCYLRPRTVKWEKHVRQARVPPMIRMTVTPYDFGDGRGQSPAAGRPGTFFIDQLNFPHAECLTHRVLGPTWFRDYFQVDFEAEFEVLKEGEFEFQMGADDAFELRIDDVKLMGRARWEGFDMLRGSKFLDAGKHRVNVSYFQSDGFSGVAGFYRPADGPADSRFAIGLSSEFIRFRDQGAAGSEVSPSDADGAPAAGSACPRLARDLRLTDIPPLFCYQAWGDLRYGRTVDGSVFRIAGTDYDVPGLGTHARSILVYDISRYGECVFSAKVGRDEAARDPLGRIKPRVVLDGRILFDGPALLSADPPVSIELPVRGGRLSLVVLETNDGISCDHADWLEPVLKPRPGESAEGRCAGGEPLP